MGKISSLAVYFFLVDELEDFFDPPLRSGKVVLPPFVIPAGVVDDDDELEPPLVVDDELPPFVLDELDEEEGMLPVWLQKLWGLSWFVCGCWWSLSCCECSELWRLSW